MKDATLSNLHEGLTSDQQGAFKAFSSWLESAYYDHPFVLSGFAGSGKTFLSMRFLRLVEAKKLCWTVVAPTHKAVGVLRQALTSEGLSPTWYPSTIHRLLRIKLKRNGALEVCEETEKTKHSLEQLGLVLIDEASMIDSKLLQIVLQCAFPYKTRLVFVGDVAQLPPVGEGQSSVFSIQKASNFQLNHVVRHRGPVLELASRLRDGRIPCKCPPFTSIVKRPEGIVGCLDQDKWLDRAKKALKSAAFEDNPDAARILCYTNRTLENLVPHVRRAIHGEMAEQMPVLPGEVLISRMAVMAQASREGAEKGEEPDLVLGSNRELVVMDVTPESFDLTHLGLSEEFDSVVPVVETLVAKVSVGEMVLDLRLLPPVGSFARNILDETLKRLRVQAKELGKKDGRSLWRKFFLIRDSFASLGPAAVLTVHRSQGSSFEEVFIASDVFWPKDLVLRKQLVYVAVTRAKNAVWLMGKKGVTSEIQSWENNLY